MKYLIQNRKEFAISVGFFIMTAVNLIRAIRSGEVAQDLIVAVVYGAFGVLAWFYNMPTSEANAEFTGQMRLEKAQRAGGITGENFLDDYVEDDEGDVDTGEGEDIDDGPDDYVEDEDNGQR